MCKNAAFWWFIAAATVAVRFDASPPIRLVGRVGGKAVVELVTLLENRFNTEAAGAAVPTVDVVVDSSEGALASGFGNTDICATVLRVRAGN